MSFNICHNGSCWTGVRVLIHFSYSLYFLYCIYIVFEFCNMWDKCSKIDCLSCNTMRFWHTKIFLFIEPKQITCLVKIRRLTSMLLSTSTKFRIGCWNNLNHWDPCKFCKHYHFCLNHFYGEMRNCVLLLKFILNLCMITSSKSNNQLVIFLEIDTYLFELEVIYTWNLILSWRFFACLCWNFLYCLHLFRRDEITSQY